MRRVLLFFALAGLLQPEERTYELRGSLVPPSPATVSLFGSNTPFHADSEADPQGHFRFRALAPGQYTVAVFVPGSGEIRQTIDLGPSTTNAKGRLELTIPISDSGIVSGESLPDRAKVSTRELSIPQTARREYDEAQKSLGRRDVPSAIAHLERAVAIAPQYAAAWNNLGTVSYQTRQYARADECFRKALDQNPGSYEPLVNLGGVLLNEAKPRDALSYNRSAVRSRPHDALANAQLGLNYFLLENLEEARKYLETAKGIDPAHFSYPQLTLAKIHLLRKEPDQAAEELRDFLRRHPGVPEAGQVREQLRTLEEK